MGLEGRILSEVQRHVAELTRDGEARILDAATGAGETTLQIAQAMAGGLLLTVDNDAASWHEWAQPALSKADVLDRVSFLHADLRDLADVESASIDLVVSHSTLSTLGVYVVDAIREFHRVLKPAGCLAIADLVPEDESEPHSGNVSALSWRLMKAAEHLAGATHYEELPTEWVKARLLDAGFDIDWLDVEPARRDSSESSFKEWRALDVGADIPDETLRNAFREAQRRYVVQADVEGLTTKTGYYACWVRRRE